jgi:putative hydrolase of the HAD superfamily
LKAYLEPILTHPPFSMPGAKAVLGRLKSKGWKLGLISNTGRTSGDYLRKVLQGQGVFELLDAFFFSDEQGVRKPHRTAFTATLDRLKVKPEESFHLGDSWEADVVGAQTAGATPLWYCPNGAEPPDPTVKKIRNWKELEFLEL